MSYSLDPKRECTHIVVDDFDPMGREIIYAGTYEDCVMYMAEQAKHSSCIGMDIILNPYYKRVNKKIIIIS